MILGKTIFLFGGQTHMCWGLPTVFAPQGSLLEGSRDQFQGSKNDWLYEKQIPFTLYYHFRPKKIININFLCQKQGKYRYVKHFIFFSILLKHHDLQYCSMDVPHQHQNQYQCPHTPPVFQGLLPYILPSLQVK